MTTANHDRAVTMTTAAYAASASPALTGALDTLMRAYMPCAGAPQPPTYADWIPAAPSWPPELLALHSACIDARRAWGAASDAYAATQGAGREHDSASVAAILASISYHALERATREAIAEWTRERLAAGDPAPRSSAASAQEGEEEEGPLW